MRRDIWEAVKTAAAIYQFSDVRDQRWCEESVLTLGAHGIWSLTHISAITGVSMSRVRSLISKTDRTGGRLNPASFQLILEEFSVRSTGETNDKLTARIIAEGTSAGMLARLLDVPVGKVRSQLARLERNAKEAEAGLV